MLEDLGAWIEGSQFLEPDGHFPNHIPNPENKEAMASISAAVKRVDADLGIIFDADCDRAAIVDHTGKEINRNRLIALISAILLDETPGATHRDRLGHFLRPVGFHPRMGRRALPLQTGLPQCNR